MGVTSSSECPLVFATESGGHAMGIYSPDQRSRGGELFFAVRRPVPYDQINNNFNLQHERLSWRTHFFGSTAKWRW
jgi:hypothetical protein